MDNVSFFLLNVFLNSLLSFFTVAFLIEAIIFLFRIPQGRIAATLRMVPIFKLPIDLCLYDFSRWSYAHGINPLNCEEGTRTLSVSVMFGWISEVHDRLFLQTGIQLTLPGNMTFTIADILGYAMKSEVLNILALFFITLSAVLIGTRLIKYYQSIKSLNALTKTARSTCRKMHNSTLVSCQKKYGFQILTSPHHSGSPAVAGLISSNVYFPEKLSQTLSRKEYEAVLAHEIEHIRYKDSLVRFILDMIESIFWWIPTKWLHKRIEDDQEVSCDLKCQKYGIQPLDLASAIRKSARHSINTSNQIFSLNLTKDSVYKRVNNLLHPTSIRFRKMNLAISLLAIGIALMILLGRFWIF